MTKEEAIKAMKDKTPVIYTGKGSLGRAHIYPNGKLRGSLNSIGIIKKVSRSTADVYPDNQSYRFHLKDLHFCTCEELKIAKEYNKKHYPALVSTGYFTY
ncbi:MAG: hypothetical protein AB1765_12865 [Candidatus Hydrogenedentota bacterium]